MRPASILVVDDDEALRGVIRRVLRSVGHDVEEAVGGAQALQRIAAEPPDLVITDLMMPEGDGFELLNELRRTHPQVRVLMITGRGSMGHLDALKLAQHLGAHATLQKPMTRDDLLGAVEALLWPERAPTSRAAGL